MMKTFAVFVAGMLGCFAVVKVTEGDASVDHSQEVKEIQVELQKLKKNDLSKDLKIKKLQSELANQDNVVNTTVASVKGLSKEQVQKMINASVANLNTVEGAKVADASSLTDEGEKQKETIKNLINSFANGDARKQIAQTMRENRLKGIELTDIQTEDIKTIWTEYDEASAKLREEAFADVPDDASRDDRSAAWKKYRETSGTLRTESNEKIKTVISDDEKYAQYQKNSQRGFGGFGRSR